MTVLKPLQLVKPQTWRGTGVDEADEVALLWFFVVFYGSDLQQLRIALKHGGPVKWTVFSATKLLL